MAEPILTLDLLVERRTIKIGPKEYELLSPAEMSILDYRKIGKQAARVMEFAGKDNPTDDEVAELLMILDQLVERLLFAPPEIREKISAPQKLQIMEAFTQLQRAHNAQAAGAVAAQPAQSTGVKT